MTPAVRREGSPGDALVLEEVLRPAHELLAPLRLAAGADTAGQAAGLQQVAAALAFATSHPNLPIVVLLALARAFRSAAAPTHAPGETAEEVGRALREALLLDAHICHSTIRIASDRLEASAREHVRLSEAQLASELGVHASHLGRLFRITTGIGFREWRRGQLVKLALERLIDDGEQIGPIAYDLGFRHPTQFSREFRQLLGMSPRQFQRLRRRWPVRTAT